MNMPNFSGFGATLGRSVAINLPFATAVVIGTVAAGMVVHETVRKMSYDSANNRFLREIARSAVANDTLVYFATQVKDPIKEALVMLLRNDITDEIRQAIRSALAVSL